MSLRTRAELGRLLGRNEGPVGRRRAAVVVLALLLFGGIYALRVADHNAADPVLVLFVVPIALCAIEFGRRGGLAAGILALALVAVRDVADEVVVGPLGYVSRGTAFLLLGGLLGNFVTERRALEKRITRYHDISLDLIATAGFDGYFKQVNPAWERVLGFTQTELLSRPFIEFVHPEDRERTQAEAAKLANVGTDAISFHNRYRRSDGSYRWLEWNVRAVPEEGLLYATARDVTARKQADEAVRQAKEEAERANQAKSEFLSRMSHELRTPLNAILGFGQLLEMDELDSGQRESVKQILKGGHHLLNLINELLEISRIEARGSAALSLEPVHLGSAVASALDLVQPLAAERNIRIEMQLPDGDDRHVLADAQRLKQALLNLLSNAIKYNREGGSVAIALEDASADRLRVLVTDTGEGIPEQQLARLFDPFERLGAERSSTEGTGLGLTLAKLLVEAMGGTLGVESTLGVGTTFRIELGLTESQTLAQTENGGLSYATASRPMGSATLLLVEDNLSNLQLVEQIFAGRPEVELLSALEGDLGLELARHHRPDLILLDLHLPGMSGDEVLERLRADPMTRDIPVVVMSADATQGRIKRLLAAGAHAYLTKPLDVRRFLGVVEEVLRERVGV